MIPTQDEKSEKTTLCELIDNIASLPDRKSPDYIYHITAKSMKIFEDTLREVYQLQLTNKTESHE